MSDANDPQGEPDGTTVYEEKKTSPMVWIVGLLVAVLLVVLIVAVVGSDDDGDSSDTSPPATGIDVDINVGTDDTGGEPPSTEGG
mgnify:FL=1